MVKGKKLLASLVTIFMMAFMITPSVMADDETLTSADDPRESVMMLTVGYEDDGGSYDYFQYGSCFLINNEYVLTCKHVLDIDDWEAFQEWVATEFGVSNLKKDDSHIKIEIYVNRDMKVEGTMDENVNSTDLDFAAVKLARKVNDRNPVALGDSDSLSVKQSVYALGYPYDSIEADEYNTKEDVSTVDGTISKLNTTFNSGSKFIEHTANIEGGNSGGPLVDENNLVIGVNDGALNSKNYATPINKIKSGLNTFGIDYIDGSEPDIDPNPEPEPTPDPIDLTQLKAALDKAEGIDTSKYSDESVSALNSAVDNGNSVYNSSDDQTEIDAATEKIESAINGLEEKKSNTMLYIGIGVAALAIIIVAAVIIVNNGKKKKESQTPTPPVAPPTPNQNIGSDETNLLAGSAGKAYLIRKSTGERINITHQSFKIGKEQAKVNYCILNNPSVSRVHCEIVRKDSNYYVVDNGSTNFTYINGTQIFPHKETLLNDHASLKLADEEFVFYKG